MGWRPSFLCSYPQLLPQCIRLQISADRITRGQEEKLRAGLHHRREVRGRAGLPDGGGHVRHGGGAEGRPQDGLLLRPGGLQNVQRAVELQAAMIMLARRAQAPAVQIIARWRSSTFSLPLRRSECGIRVDLSSKSLLKATSKLLWALESSLRSQWYIFQ